MSSSSIMLLAFLALQSATLRAFNGDAIVCLTRERNFRGINFALTRIRYLFKYDEFREFLMNQYLLSIAIFDRTDSNFSALCVPYESIV